MQGIVRNLARHLIFYLIAVSAFFVLATYVATNLPEGASLSRITSHLTMKYEMNVGAWWSAVLLLFAALAAYSQFYLRRDNTRTAWLIISFLCTALSWDEIGSLHERVGVDGWSAFIPYALLGIVLLAYAFWKLLGNPETRKAGLTILGAFVLFALVPLQEFLGDAWTWPGALEALRSAVEEGTEIVAPIVIIMAVRNLRTPATEAVAPGQRKISLRLVRHMLGLLVSIGLVIHLILAVTIEQTVSIGRWGDPAVWFPSAVLGLAGAGAIASAREGRNIRLILGIVHLIASLAVVYLLAPQRESWMVYATYVALLVVTVALLRPMSRPALLSDYVPFGILFAVLGAAFAFDSALTLRLVSGVFVAGLAGAMLWITRHEPLSVNLTQSAQTLEPATATVGKRKKR